MTGYIPFPEIGPDIFSFDLFGFTLALRWYAMAYIVGIIIGWRLIVAAVARPALWGQDGPAMTREQVEDLLTWIVLGIIGGGRLGYVLFYQPGYFIENPVEIPMIWQGGMSFHGGFLGVIAAVYIYSRRHSLRLWSVADLLALGTPAGLLLGRLANFINNELWGRATLHPFGVAFPGAAAQDCPASLLHPDGVCARFPSQLFEAGIEGLVLGTLLVYLAFRRGALKHPMLLTGLFFANYGIARFIVEFFRQADAQFITAANPMGYILQIGDAGVTMGQLLSLPMVVIGITLLLIRPRP